MAKTEPKPAATTAANENSDVMNEIRKGGLMKQSMTQEVEDEIKKEKDDRLKAQLKDRILRAGYRRMAKRLDLRLRREEAKITKDILKKSEILEDRVKGFYLDEEKLATHGGKDGKLSIEVITEEGKKETKEFALPKKGEKIWVPAGITIAEYDTKAAELVNEERKRFDEASKEDRKNREELEAQYPGYFRYEWRW